MNHPISFRLAIAFLLAVVSVPLQAQVALNEKDVHTAPVVQKVAKWDSARTILKVSPTSFLEPEASMEVSLEFKPTVKIGYQLSAAYIFAADPLAMGFGTFDMVGYKTRGQLRTYGGYDFYVALDFLYKELWYSRDGDVGYNCDGEICDYYREHEYRVHKQVYAYHVVFGGQTRVAPSSPLYIDGYVGFGFRHVRADVTNLPDGFEPWSPNRGWFGWTRDQNFNIPSLMAGFKIGWRLK